MSVQLEPELESRLEHVARQRSLSLTQLVEQILESYLTSLPDSPDEPQPFETAMMMASVQLDELARIGFDTFRPNDTFDACEGLSVADPETLTDLEREILEYAVDGFNVGAIADMVAAPDADILKALAVLADVGAVVRRRSP